MFYLTVFSINFENRLLRFCYEMVQVGLERRGRGAVFEASSEQLFQPKCDDKWGMALAQPFHEFVPFGMVHRFCEMVLQLRDESLSWCIDGTELQALVEKRGATPQLERIS